MKEREPRMQRQRFSKTIKGRDIRSDGAPRVETVTRCHHFVRITRCWLSSHAAAPIREFTQDARRSQGGCTVDSSWRIKLRAILNWVAHINRLGAVILIAVLDRETHY